MKHVVSLQILILILGAYAGIVFRVSLTALSKTLNSDLFDLWGHSWLLPNFIGCLIMGMMKGIKKIKKWDVVWITGITSGFCGSCTTFSTWQNHVAQTIVDGPHIVDGILQLILGFMWAICAYKLGGYLIQLKYKNQGILSISDVTLFQEDRYGTVVIVVLVSTVLVWVLYFLDASRREDYLAICIGPVGALLRYHWSLKNKAGNIPYYTLLANLIATWLQGGLLVVLSSTSSSTSTDNWLSGGVSTGLFGSLSTVSTWIDELHGLVGSGKHKEAAMYIGLSLVATVGSILILGSWIWTDHELTTRIT